MSIVRILVLLIVAAGVILLQIFLSNGKSKWPGLILPFISFCISLIYVLNVSAAADISTVIMTIAMVFLICNIPTVVLLAIYAVCRGKRKSRRDLDKMSVQDLH